MEINKIDSFQDNKFNISKEYDLNKDGTVDIQDYNFALLSLEDEDPDNDVKISKEELNTVFKDLIEEDNKVNPDEQEVTEDNVNELAQEVIDRAKTEIVNPEDAKTFTELQTIGQNLSKIIKRCTKLLPVLNQQIEALNKELEEIEEEKKTKEEEYNGVVEVVNEKNTQLNEKFSQVLNQSQTVSEEMKTNANNIINKCISDYKDGKYKDKNLYDVIISQLAGNDESKIAALNLEINDCDTLGNEIKGLCTDIEGLVSDIKNITSKFNDKTDLINTLKNSRTGVLATSNQASAEYQKGYQKRLDLRQEMINQYQTSGWENQLNSMGSFLDNATDIPFADAFAVLAGIGGETGIGFSYGSVTMPTFTYEEGDEEGKAEAEAKTAKYNALAEKIRSAFGKDSVTNKEDDTEEEFGQPTEATCFNGCVDSTCCEIPKPEPVSSCDPMTFSKDGVTNHFIQDRDNDGIFDDATEFLGAKDGWEEMKAYDADGNGKIEGKELDELKMVSVDDKTGQFTFQTAAEAGIESIDLSSYQQKGQNQVDGDVLRGEFDIKMKDGSTVKAEQTDDTAKNIEMRYASLFGTKIEDWSDEYEENEFMEEFIEKLDTKSTVSMNESNSLNVKKENEANITTAKKDSNKNAEKKADEAQDEKENKNSELIDKDLNAKKKKSN